MEVAAGLYTKIIFPDALPKTEPHLSDVQKAMLDATPDCIKVLSTDGKLIAMNRAGCLALDVPEDSGFGMPWLPLLPEDVREFGLGALQKAAAGAAAKFPGRSRSANGIRYWDNLLTPVFDTSGHVMSILCVSRDVSATAVLNEQLEAALRRERLLSQEMQHRIKNLFSIVSALITISEREASKENTPLDASRILREKVEALSRASAAAFSSQGGHISDTNQIELGELVRSVLQPYGDRCHLAGSPVFISRGNMTTVALLLHELGTNAVKYGALSTEGGSVTISWLASQGSVDLTWVEAGGPDISSPPKSRGFGTEMVERIVHSAGGHVTRTWARAGLIAKLYLPNET